MEFLKSLMLVFALSLSRTEGEQSYHGRSTCEPFRLLIVWHTSSGDGKSYYQQKRFIIDFIDKLMDDTEILLATVDTTLKYLEPINKDSTDTRWRRTIASHKPKNLRNHIIPHSLISEAVYTFLDKDGNKKIAKEIVFVVNGNSDINDKKRVKEILKHKITFVVFIGTNPPPEVWTNLATDKTHRFVLSDSLEESVQPVAEELLILSCQDSRLKCDLDEYWTGNICYTCSHICSIDTKFPSETCLKECPYSRLKCDLDEYWTGNICHTCSHICSIDTKFPSEMCLKECPYFASHQYPNVAEDRRDARNQPVLVGIVFLLLSLIPLFHFCKICTKRTKQGYL